MNCLIWTTFRIQSFARGCEIFGDEKEEKAALQLEFFDEISFLCFFLFIFIILRIPDTTIFL